MALTALSVLLLSLGSYLFEVYGRGVRPLDASKVFQPAVVLESLAAFLGLFTLRRTLGRQAPDLSLRSADQGRRGSIVRNLPGHPLVLQVVLGLGTLTGLLTILQQASASVSLAVAITVVLPVVFTVSWILVGPALRATQPADRRPPPP